MAGRASVQRSPPCAPLSTTRAKFGRYPACISGFMIGQLPPSIPTTSTRGRTAQPDGPNHADSAGTSSSSTSSARDRRTRISGSAGASYTRGRPGWEAFLAGRPVQHRRRDPLLQLARVPPRELELLGAPEEELDVVLDREADAAPHLLAHRSHVPVGLAGEELRHR